MPTAPSVIIPPLPEFKVGSYFYEGTTDEGVKFGYIGESFFDNFDQLVEPATAETRLFIRTTGKSVSDREIVKQVGEDRIATGLKFIYEMLKRQPNGEDGDLSIGNCCNMFFVISPVDGNLWNVNFRWNSHDTGWDIEAYPLDDTKWLSGQRIFTR